MATRIDIDKIKSKSFGTKKEFLSFIKTNNMKLARKPRGETKKEYSLRINSFMRDVNNKRIQIKNADIRIKKEFARLNQIDVLNIDYDRYNDRELLKSYKSVNEATGLIKVDVKFDIILAGSIDYYTEHYGVNLLKNHIDKHLLVTSNILQSKGINFAGLNAIVVYYANNGMNLKTVKLGDLMMLYNNLNTSSIYALVAANFASIEVRFAIIGYRVLPIVNGNFNIVAKYAKGIRAFSPNCDRKFHEMTQCSTTVERICIYQTYYYLYKLNGGDIKKFSDEIKLSLENENDIVKEYVRKGELINFLSHMSKIHNESMYVEFFNPSIMIGMKITGDVIEEVKDYNNLVNMKIFLYDKQHVAPRKNINTDLVLKYRSIQKRDFKNANQKIKPDNLKTIKTSLISKVYGWDGETYCDSNGKAIPYCICLTDETGSNSFYGEDCITTFVNHLDSIKTVTSISKSKSKVKVPRIHIYGFNNAKFDNILIFNELINRNPSCVYIIDGSTIKYLKYHNIYIYDIRLYYSQGNLKMVSKSFNLDITKGVFPYSFVSKDNLNYIGDIPAASYWKKESHMTKYIETEKVQTFNMKEYTIKYCVLDCELVRKIANKHLELSSGKINDKLFDIRTCSTSAGMTLKLFTQIFLKDDLFISPTKIIEKERRAYKGGRTEVFKKEFTANNIKMTYADINSSYPASMTKLMPYKYINTIRFNVGNVVKVDQLCNYYLYVAKVRYMGTNKHFIPNILIKDANGNNVTSLETEYAEHWGCELIEAINNECEVTIIEVNQYEGKFIFKDFSNYFYEERLKCKTTNIVKAQFYKNLLNSLYGKWGQKSKSNTIICKDSTDISIIANNINNKIVSFDTFDDKILLTYTNEEDTSRDIGNFVRFSSYISALSRCNLSLFMRKVGHEHVYYCDTDSVFCDVEPPKELIDNNTLGKWKIEDNTITRAIFLAPKSYYYKSNNETVMKAKGMPNKKLEIKFYQDILQGKSQKIVNDSMFFRSLSCVHIKPQERTLDIVYNKRIFNGNDSTAFKTYDDWKNNKNYLKSIKK